VNRRPAARGQASIELLAMVPLIILAGLLAWQLMAVLTSGLQAQDEVRAKALRAGPASAGTTIVTSTVPVPSLLPGVHGLSIRAAAGIRTP
jgi:hypothetical protein